MTSTEGDNNTMKEKNYKCLCDIEDVENEIGTVTQEIEVTLKDTKVSFDIIRELAEGGNISEVRPYFENNPYIEDNQVKYDEDLTILQDLFNQNYVEFDTGDHIDQILWDMDVGDEKEFNIKYTDNMFEVTEYNVTIKLISNLHEMEE